MKHRYKIFQESDSNAAMADMQCAQLALLGFSTRCIAKATKLTESQVQYRVSRAGIKRWDFRHGLTPLAAVVSRRISGDAYNIYSKEILPRFKP